MSENASFLNRVQNQLGLLDKARNAFEFYLRKDKEHGINATLTVDQGVVHVHFLGQDVAAVPRIVIVGGDLALEYTFVGQCRGEAHAVWQFYLIEEGQQKYSLARKPSSDVDSRMCDHTNQYAAVQILDGVCRAILSSPLMLPAPLDAY